MVRNMEELRHSVARLEREQNFSQHMLRKIAKDRNLPQEEIEIDAVSRYIPCYDMSAVRELESNLQKDDQFKKNLVSVLFMSQ